MNMRDIITLIETQELDEIELGGQLDSSFVDDLDKKDLSSDQLDLFEPTTTGQPRLPANMKLIGRTGAYYVAQRTGPLPGQSQSKDEHLYVFIKDNKAAGYICLYPWSGDHVNYPHQVSYQPDLHGKGLRTAAVMVMPDFRGQNLGPTMYKWVLENVCDYIIADATHTQGGAALWKRMRAMKNVFAVEIWNADKYETQPRWHRHVYDRDHYIPWITLRGREHNIRTGEDDE
jgi:GNAT superfamily N-acetyltransferase